MTFFIKNKFIAKYEDVIYTWLCIAIVYTMLLLTYVNTLLIILLASFWLFFSEKKFNIRSGKTKLLLLFVSLYLIGVAGLIITSDTQAGLATLKTKSALFFFPLIFGTTHVLSPAKLRTILNHFLIAVAIASLAGLGYGLYHFIQTGNPEKVTGSSILLFHAFRPPLMGLFCLLAVIIAFQKLPAAAGKRKILLWAFICLMTLMILLLSIRLIIFCWLLTGLFFLMKQILSWKKRILFLTTIIAIFFVSSIAIPSLKQQWRELFDFSKSNFIILDRDASMGKSWGGKALRVAIWQCSADILHKHWLTGVGTGNVQHSLQQAYENRMFYFASRYNRYNAHNQYLQIALANGMPGLLLLLCCIGYPLLHYRKKFSGDVYGLFLLLFAAAGLTESLLEVNKGIVWYSFFNSIFAFGFYKKQE